MLLLAVLFLFAGCDGGASAGAGTDANTAPVAEDVTVATDEDTAVEITLVATDVEEDTLTFAVVAEPANGALACNAEDSSSCTYTPNADFNGPDSFTYTASDGTEDSAEATVTITVAAINDAPTIDGAPTAAATEDSDYSDTGISASDVDEGDTLTFSMTGNPEWLSIDSVTGELTGTPLNADVGASAAFTVQVQDDSGDTGNDIGTANVTITVANTNDDPTISGTPATTIDEDSAYGFTPGGGDVDVPHGDTLIYTMTGDPAWLSIDAATGELSGTPLNDDVGTSGSITVTVTDSASSAADLAAFTITVANSNDAPTVSGTPTDATEDSGYSFTMTGGDVDVGDSITYSLGSSPDWLSINASTGELTGTPLNADVGASSAFTVQVQDDSGDTGNDIGTANFNITVANTNDAPTISGSPATTIDEDSAYGFTPGGGDVDVPHGDTLIYTMTGDPAWLSIDAATGELSGTPLNDDVGTSGSITVTVTDSASAGADLAAFTITVANTIDAPMVSTPIPDQEAPAITFPFDIDLSAYLTDEDVGDSLTYSVTANSDDTTISTAMAGATLTLTNPGGTSLVVSITVRATDDSTGALWVEDTFDVLFIPTLYANGMGWNDYVKNDGADEFSAGDVACDGSETGGYDACIHGGEIRTFDTGDTTACGSLSAADALAAFDWVCANSGGGGTAVFTSSGLAAGKYLSDLIDFITVPAAPAWQGNQLIVTGGAGYTSTVMKWWDNPIVVDNDGMIAGDAVAGTIYVVTSDPAAIYVIDASNVGLVIRPGVTMTGSAATNENLIYAETQNFLWLEGALDATDDIYGIYWYSVKFSVLRGVGADNANNSGVYLYSSSNNTLSGINAANNFYYGVVLGFDSTYNTLSDVSAANNGRHGVLVGSSNNALSGISAANNGQHGLFFSGSSNNTLSGISAANNSVGVYLLSSSNNTLSGISAANNGYIGFYITAGSKYNTLSGISAANNGSYGVRLYSNSANNYFTGLLKVGGNVIGDCYVNRETFDGALADDAGSVDATHDGLCLQVTPSDFGTAITDVTMAGSFYGKVTVDDVANSSDTNGVATYPIDPTSFDWTNFDNIYSGWGIEGSDFPNADHQGRFGCSDASYINETDCTNNGGTWNGAGRIWDWSLAAGDTGDAGGPVALGEIACPADGNDTFTRAWFYDTNADGVEETPASQADCDAYTPAGAVYNAGTCESTFLRNAVEIMADGIGNDNNLCESGEECLYTPNIGAYQGHGNLVSAATAVTNTFNCADIPAGGTAVSDIILWKYDTNGY